MMDTRKRDKYQICWDPHSKCECEKLNYKRLKSFNKRNKEKLELAAALNAQRHTGSGDLTEEEGSRRSSFSSLSYTADSPGTSSTSMDTAESNTRKQSPSSRTGLEGRSMSLGAMTVMSYDIWKAKCAAEKKRLEAEGKVGADGKVEDDPMISASPPARKRAHTFVAMDEPKEIPKVSPPNLKEKKGRYILLPTIPAMKVFVGEDSPAIVPTEPTNIPVPPAAQEKSVATSTAPLGLPSTMTLPATSMPVSLPPSLPRPSPIAVTATAPSFFHPSLSSVAAVPPVVPTTTTHSPFTDQLLASLLPSSVLLQNAGLIQQSALASLLSLVTTPVITPPSTSCASDVMALLRAQQSAQLAAALALPNKNNLLPTSTPDDLIQSLLAQTRQPIFSHSL
ncbi:hypothetical protein KIN20_024579 [Parelaphostrongylus tenuis]|uniref:Uncharacterized protein n=1 Tax=Parelaphostrongylus tenuis TaxID=148309 RepID=A0AAD5N8B5_PARTN|nr:hypothetical protein KIN20_024579 [Parelaphostrongylus tenuis]